MSKQIRALARGLSVVNAIDASRTPMSLGELHRDTAIDKATLLRILATLEHAGWVYKGIGDGRYRLTYRLHDLGINVNVSSAFAEVSAPVLDRLQRELRWPSDISVFDGESMVIVESSRSRTAFVLNRELLGYRPSMLKSAMGRVYLAFCDERRQQAILQKLAEKGGYEGDLARNRQYIDGMITEIRHKGFALRDSSLAKYEQDEALGAIAVPIIVMGDVQACLNLVWPRDAYPDLDVETTFYPRLREAADSLAAIFDTQGLY